MKIGKYDISIPTLAYAIGLVVAAIFLLGIWKKNANVRVEAFYSGTIYQGMYDDTPEALAKATEACKSLIEFNPAKTSAHFYLADLQMKQKSWKDAQKSYESAEATSGATAKEKGMALVAQGVAAFYGAPRDNENLSKAIVAAEPFFHKAMEADKLNVDALVNLALLEFKKGGPDALLKAEKFCARALDAVHVPSLKASEQMYMLAAQFALKADKPAVAAAHFERARAMRLNWKTADDGRRIASLAVVTQKKMEVAIRRELLTNLESDVLKFGKDKSLGYNAMGIGTFMLKGEPTYNEKELINAIRLFGKAIETDAKDSRGYFNLAALHQDRFSDLAKKLNIPVTGVNGETQPLNRWRDPENATKFPPMEKIVINQLKAVLRDEDEVWKKFLERSKATNAQRIDAKLRQLSCVRRQLYLLDYDEEPINRPQFLNRATTLGKDLETLGANDSLVRTALGNLELDRGDYSKALSHFSVALEKSAGKSPELQRIVDLLSAKPQVTDVRPREGRRYYGPRPLISGTLRAVSATGVPKKATMKLGALVVEPLLSPPLGLQVLFYPTDKELADGDQDVSITVIDALDQPIEFPPFKFGMDKQPPSWSVSPASGTPISTKPVFTVTLSDRGNIDYNSLRLALKPADAKRATQQIVMIADGRCKVTMPDLTPPRKIGYPIDNDSFPCSPGRELAPGDWELTITVGDLSGNILTESKKFSVK